MIRPTIRLRANNTERFLKRVAASADRVLDTVETTFRTDVQPELFAALQQTPGAVKYPFQFATEKSRRYYFASNNSGKGIPSTRTGAIVKGYRVIVERSTGRIRIRVVNTAAGYPFVKGRRQVAGHRNTGWQPDAPIAARFVPIALDRIGVGISRLNKRT